MTESVLQGNFVVTYNPSLVNAVQDRTLVRVFREALYPRILYRGEAEPELWVSHLGATQTFTRTGLIRPTTRPIPQNADPTPKSYEIEQWEAYANQYGDSIDTMMLTSHVSLASTYLRNMNQLGLHSGQSMNRVCRDKTFNAYTAGNSVVRATVGAGTTFQIQSLNGFSHRLANGRPTPVAPTNPLPITIISGAVATRYNVVGVAPDVAGDFIHGGTVTLDVAHAGLSARDIVLADNRSLVVNSGGSASIDGIGTGDQLTLADFRLAIAQMRAANTPPHEDGTYHAHLDPISESQLFGDNEFQRLNQSLPDYLHYREFAIAMLLGTTFYRNNESPLSSTVDQDPRYGYTFAPETFNTPPGGLTPVEIHRVLLTGLGYLEEKYLDESKYISDAGTLGKIGEFNVNANGMQVMTERIRLILRGPVDRLQQQVSTTWSWSGDFVLPTDELSAGQTRASFRRATVLQHGA